MAEFTTLRTANAVRQTEWDPGKKLTLTYRSNELAGEVGETCNVAKKLERERLGIRGSRDTVEHLAEELADVIICADLVALEAGIDLDAAVVSKFNATSEKNNLATRLRAPDCGAAQRIAQLEAALNTPEVDDFAKGVVAEAQHQRQRWPSEQDAGKTAWDWFWLIGYLAQKAATAQIAGDQGKALHHTISTAAALANWHAAITGQHSTMRPGIAAQVDA